MKAMGINPMGITVHRRATWSVAVSSARPDVKVPVAKCTSRFNRRERTRE